MELLKIDLNRILRSRIGGWKGKLIPGFLISGLEKLIHQKELNEILSTTYPAEGSDFSDGVFRYLDLEISAYGMENIREGKRYVFASNHPLGGLDGIGLIKILGRRYGDDNVRFLVNDMLMNVEPLRKVFLPINKYGSQGREAARAINEAYASDRQILMFPAGLVSRLHPDGKIRDLEWQKSFISKAIESNRDIIPVYFEGLNRPRFYRIARLRRRLGIKINLEQALLPSEVCAARGKTFKVTFGKPIPVESLKESGKSYSELARNLHDYIYEKLAIHDGKSTKTD